MKKADYAFTTGDKMHRILSLILALSILGWDIYNMRMLVLYPYQAAPLFATAMIWYSDALSSSLPWIRSSQIVRIIGWTFLVIYTLITLL
jgi:hypothetical protein